MKLSLTGSCSLLHKYGEMGVNLKEIACLTNVSMSYYSEKHSWRYLLEVGKLKFLKNFFWHFKINMKLDFNLITKSLGTIVWKQSINRVVSRELFCFHNNCQQLVTRGKWKRLFQFRRGKKGVFLLQLYSHVESEFWYVVSLIETFVICDGRLMVVYTVFMYFQSILCVNWTFVSPR